MIRVKMMPPVFRYLSYFNYIRYGLESMLIDVYGFDRCSALTTNTTVDVMDAIPMEKMLELYGSGKVDVDSLASSVDSLMIGSHRKDSIILDHFDLGPFEFYRAIVLLVINFLLFRVITYYLLVRKTNIR